MRDFIFNGLSPVIKVGVTPFWPSGFVFYVFSVKLLGLGCPFSSLSMFLAVLSICIKNYRLVFQDMLRPHPFKFIKNVVSYNLLYMLRGGARGGAVG
jgi:hypothetical protein